VACLTAPTRSQDRPLKRIPSLDKGKEILFYRA
jgi:hypothetical protein